jgi:hypothetical protein
MRGGLATIVEPRAGSAGHVGRPGLAHGLFERALGGGIFGEQRSIEARVAPERLERRSPPRPSRLRGTRRRRKLWFDDVSWPARPSTRSAGTGLCRRRPNVRPLPEPASGGARRPAGSTSEHIEASQAERTNPACLPYPRLPYPHRHDLGARRRAASTTSPPRAHAPVRSAGQAPASGSPPPRRRNHRKIPMRSR